MKKLIYSACISTLALAVSVAAADNINDSPKRARGTQKASTTQAASVRTTNAAQVNVHHNNTGARFQQRSALSTNRNHINSTVANRNHVRNRNVTVSRQQNVSNRNLRHTTVKTADLNRSTNLTVNRNRNLNRSAQNLQVNRNRNVTVNRHRNVLVTNNWRGQRFSGQQYVAFRNYHRQWHDRNWWSSNYPRLTFFLGGAYYWNSGYWYPAWGYDPGYNYAYDGPIYGYDNLSPDQVVVNVQSQLQRDGYYSGPIDGQLGSMTRQAIADFQADRGLAVTAAVDQPTLASLGLAS
jgi:hypothetical protein